MPWRRSAPVSTSCPTPHQPGPMAEHRRLLQQHVHQGDRGFIGTTLDAAALLPRSNADATCRPIHNCIAQERRQRDHHDRRPRRRRSTANAKYQDFFRQIVTRFEVSGRAADRRDPAVMWSSTPTRVSIRHQHRDGSLLGIQLQAAFAKDDVVERGRLTWASPTSSSASLPENT